MTKMLNIKRQILLNLVMQDKVTSHDLAKLLHVTPKTIRNNIKQLNDIFTTPIISYQKPYFYLQDKKRVVNYIATKSREAHYPNYPEDRLFLIYLALYQQKLVKVDTLMAQLLVGRNEIEKGIKDLKQVLPDSVKIIATKRGLYLAGDLVWQNYCLAKLATKRINRLISNQYLRLIFGSNFETEQFAQVLTILDKTTKDIYYLALNDRNLYILTIMHFLAGSDQLLLQATQDFTAEYVLDCNSRILKLNNIGGDLYQKLLAIFPNEVSYLYQMSGNIANHLKLLQRKTKYFHLHNKAATIKGLLIKYTEQDNEYLTHLQASSNSATPIRIVIYDPNISQLADYQDQLAPLTNLFSQLELVVTTNLFELNQLLHCPNEQVIFVAEKARISLTDKQYDISFVPLNKDSKHAVINLLFTNKGTA